VEYLPLSLPLWPPSWIGISLGSKSRIQSRARMEGSSTRDHVGAATFPPRGVRSHRRSVQIQRQQAAVGLGPQPGAHKPAASVQPFRPLLFIENTRIS
jgi:hypothetical protein